MIVDIGKGYLAASLVPDLALPGIADDPDVARTWLTLICAGAAIVGHCYPVWFGFAGGKGAATTVGVLIAIAPGLLVIAGIVFASVLILSGYVGLATMTSAFSLPVFVAVTGFEDGLPMFFFLAALAVFVMYTHRGNIQRMRAGEENRLERAMLLRRR